MAPAGTATQDALQEGVRKRDHREFVLMGCNAYEVSVVVNCQRAEGLRVNTDAGY